jgi:phage gpG-like protein
MSIAVTVDTRDVERLLADFHERGEDLSPIMAEVAEMLVAGIEDEFQTQGRGNWAPLAASTLRSRRGSSAMILQDTGRLAGSIQPRSGPDFAEAGSDVAYGKFHITGTRHMPARNFLDIDEQVFDEAEMAILDYMTEALK